MPRALVRLAHNTHLLHTKVLYNIKYNATSGQSRLNKTNKINDEGTISLYI